MPAVTGLSSELWAGSAAALSLISEVTAGSWCWTQLCFLPLPLVRQREDTGPHTSDLNGARPWATRGAPRDGLCYEIRPVTAPVRPGLSMCSRSPSCGVGGRRSVHTQAPRAFSPPAGARCRGRPWSGSSLGSCFPPMGLRVGAEVPGKMPAPLPFDVQINNRACFGVGASVRFWGHDDPADKGLSASVTCGSAQHPVCAVAWLPGIWGSGLSPTRRPQVTPPSGTGSFCVQTCVEPTGKQAEVAQAPPPAEVLISLLVKPPVAGLGGPGLRWCNCLGRPRGWQAGLDPLICCQDLGLPVTGESLA